MNKKFILYLPVIIALSIVTGILLSNWIVNSEKKIVDNTEIKFNNKTPLNKLKSLFYYLESEYVDTVNIDSIVDKTIELLLQQLDPHSIYIPPSEYAEMNEPLEGSFEGIGIEFSIQNDTIVVMNTIIGGPSEKVGLMPGDRIVKVNDSIVAGVGITNSDVLRLLKGKKGTRVNVAVKRRRNKDLLSFTIIRDKIPMHSIDAALKFENNIGYIKIARFAKTTPQEFREALNKLFSKGVKKLIVDLRGNGGGYMDAAIAIADEFLKKGDLIVYTEGKAKPREDYYATKYGIAEDIPLCILIDEGSASASEILAGAIQDNDRGIIVGRPSFGKGLVQEPVMFSDGSSLRLTVARYHTPSGRCIQRNYKKGILNYYTDYFLHFDSLIKDTVNAPKYKTRKGRIVYGKGGIIPDTIVKSQQNIPEVFYNIINQSVIYQFAFQYTDVNRSLLISFKTWQELDNYIKRSNVYNEFIVFLKRQNISVNAHDEKIKKLVMNYLRAYIVRNMNFDDGFYNIVLEDDQAFEVAKKAIQK